MQYWAGDSIYWGSEEVRQLEVIATLAEKRGFAYQRLCQVAPNCHQL